MVFLHDAASNQASCKALALQLREAIVDSAFILVRGLQAVPGRNKKYRWTDPECRRDEGFTQASKLLLVDVIKQGLIITGRCFSPQDIVIVGHGQGGIAALAAVASWNKVPFGGVISIGGSMPEYPRMDSLEKIMTSALILGSSPTDTNRAALQQAKDRFVTADGHELSRDVLLESEEITVPLLQFLAHPPIGEEWTKEAVISFGKLSLRE